MFTAKDHKSTLDPYFRIAYFLQVVAAGAMAAGLFLTWWGGGTGDSLTGFDILSRSLDRLRGRSPLVVLEPLFMLWFVGPVIVVSLLRGMTGILVVPVWYRKVAFATWLLAAFALAHFFINYGHDLAESSPLKDGHIQPGFWLTASSATILGVLILTESLIREPDSAWAVPQPLEDAADEAERLWRGDYLTCPHCGMLNAVNARSCYNCHNVLFNFRDDA